MINNEERLQNLNSLLTISKLENFEFSQNKKGEIDLNEEQQAGEPDILMQDKKSMIFFNKNKKLLNLKSTTELLIKVQKILISFIDENKKAKLSQFIELECNLKKQPELALMKETELVFQNYKDFNEILSEINLKIMQKQDYLIQELIKFDKIFKNNKECNIENVVESFIDHTKTFFTGNYSEIQLVHILNKLNSIIIDSSQSPGICLLDSQTKQLQIIATFISNFNPIRPELLEKLIKDSLGFIVFSSDIQKLWDLYSKYKLWKNSLDFFKKLRRNCKISNYILQEKPKKIFESNAFIYLSNTISLETAPKITYNSKTLSLLDYLTMENLSLLIKNARQLIPLDLNEEINELDAILKKSFLFQQTLQYIYDLGVSKSSESKIEIEFSLEEILTKMEECNLFFPIYFSFESQKKKFSLLRNFFGFTDQEYRLAYMPYQNLEDEVINQAKEKALHDLYKFLQEKEITKENLKMFSSSLLLFESCKDNYPDEYKILKDLNSQYHFLISLLNLYEQWSHKILENKDGFNGNLIELSNEINESIYEKYDNYSSLDLIFFNCQIFIAELEKDLGTDLIKYDWEKHIDLVDKNINFYGTNHDFLTVMGKYKLFLWLKQTLKFFQDNSKDYSKFYQIQLSLQELNSKYGLSSLIHKEVLYDEFQNFTTALNQILAEITEIITNKKKLKILIHEDEIPSIEEKLKDLKKRIVKLGLNYPMITNTISDFEYCCLASKKAGHLFNMIVKENKKIDTNALKILIEFSRNYEFCDLFTSIVDLKNVYDYYEALISRVNSLKDSFLLKKQILSSFRVPHLKISPEKVVSFDKVIYSSNIFSFLFF